MKCELCNRKATRFTPEHSFIGSEGTVLTLVPTRFCDNHSVIEEFNYETTKQARHDHPTR